MKSTKPLHITIIADPLNKQDSGIYYYTMNLIRQLDKNEKISLSVILLDKKSEVIPATCNLQQASIHYLPNTLKLLRDDPVRTFFTLPKLIKRIKADIVVEPAHFGPFNLPRQIKRITVIHDLTPVRFSHFHRFHSQLLQRIFLPGILKRADLIITNSENTKNDVIEYSPAANGKTAMIHLGRDDIFSPKDDSEKLKAYGINKAYFLFVGTLEPRKNISLLLDAFLKIRQKDHDYQLVLVGGRGWKSKSFIKKLNNHPYGEDILLPGYVPREDLPVLYSGSYAFVYPSIYEGFGFPVLEAMACGAPVISSNTSSLPEVGGEAALYFNPNSVDELVVNMEMIIENMDLRSKLCKKSIKQAGKFSWEQFGNEFVNLLEKIYNKENK